jgi:hypothetical protein
MKKNYTLRKTSLQEMLFWCFTIILSNSLSAQTLNFTIDTAVDNGTSITETIVDGPDTYVLTVFHSGNEELDNLGGGDLVFFLSAINPLTPHNLTITKNGQPTNFKLNSIDYDTLGAGSISLTNQDDNFISVSTAYPLGAGTLTITNPENGLDITEIKINPSDSDDLNDFGFHNINVDILNTLSVDEITDIEEDIIIYPNPSNGNINIKSQSIELQNLIITDLNGRLIKFYKIKDVKVNFDLSFLTSGIYLIKLTDIKNSSITKKIIIK